MVRMLVAGISGVFWLVSASALSQDNGDEGSLPLPPFLVELPSPSGQSDAVWHVTALPLSPHGLEAGASDWPPPDWPFPECLPPECRVAQFRLHEGDRVAVDMASEPLLLQAETNYQYCMRKCMEYDDFETCHKTCSGG